jgi:hypothetical protein
MWIDTRGAIFSGTINGMGGSRAKIVTGMLVAALCLPSVLSAQEMNNREVLRAEIRAAIEGDPRAIQLSDGELSALVELLAGEAEAMEVAQDYLPPPSSGFAEYVAPLLTPWGQPISRLALYVTILLCLGVALLLLKKMAAHHKVAPQTASFQ